MSYNEQIIALCYLTGFYYAINFALHGEGILHLPAYLIKCFHLLLLLYYKITFLGDRKNK